MTTQVKESVSAWDNSNHAANPNGSSDGDSQVRLLFVDDDEDYREAVGAELVDHGFSVHGFPDGASMMDSLSAGLNADVILLDWSLPATPGIDLLPQRCNQLQGGLVVLLRAKSLYHCCQLRGSLRQRLLCRLAK